MNKNLLIGGLAIAVILLLMGFFGGRYSVNCDCTSSVKTVTKIEYVNRPDTALHLVATEVPKPYKRMHAPGSKIKSNPDTVKYGVIEIGAPETQSDVLVNYYSDSLYHQGAFRAVINDTIQGTILGRSVWFADLTPMEVKTVTNTVSIVKKPPLVKVFLGFDAYGGKSAGKYNMDLAPAGSFVFADRYMFDLGYYVFNQQVTAGVKIKLSFHK